MILYVVCGPNSCYGVFRNHELAYNLAEHMEAKVEQHRLFSEEDEWRKNYILQTTGKIK